MLLLPDNFCIRSAFRFLATLIVSFRHECHEVQWQIFEEGKVGEYMLGCFRLPENKVMECAVNGK